MEIMASIPLLIFLLGYATIAITFTAAFGTGFAIFDDVAIRQVRIVISHLVVSLGGQFPLCLPCVCIVITFDPRTATAFD
jgi:hypothetical protein